VSAHCKNRNLAKKFDLIKIETTENSNKRERIGVNYHYMAQTNNQGVANKTHINTVGHWWGFFFGSHTRRNSTSPGSTTGSFYTTWSYL